MYNLPDFERFVEVRPGLFRCTIVWPIAIGVQVPVATFLIRGDPVEPGSTDSSHDWLLIDSGAPMQAQTLLTAIERVLTHEKDKLRYICITHAHIDHTGAIPALLEKYPEAKVVIHKDEKPYICDGVSLRTCAGDTWSFTLFKHFSHESLVKVSEDRTIALGDGDQFEFDHVLKLVETRGHTPGSASYIHIPSRSIMVGDAVMNIAAYPMLSKIPCVSGPLAVSTTCWSDALRSIDKILTLKDKIDTVFPAHDYNVDGIHIDKVHEFRKCSSL
ncbi:hypothetical protein BX616_011161 [Lobosporangium transversale]|uniref:Beta-lactamase-like protein n=1 Tax=Lobosporangium transversale TaxID=64571 RepID=A0A1Y2GW71_9FUNG|nr:beta-lactamase-like protein [Lobosporangium transversale]KAF9909469.1 hypothetical protein BX616_011161 [Lobosporangium transversale]ORZ26556.1 beta-lactamase-like protein [Lobosporangium transversale]|eukprot:XP_021884319.1 beta-lactamase-like protein [Lobosporangium transversale]